MQTVGIQIAVGGQQQAAAALNSTSTRLDKFRAKLSKASAPATIAGAGILAFAKAAGTAASDVQQAMGGVESVFGKNAETVKAWSRAAADSVGLAQDEYATAASKFGAQFKNMGLAQDDQLAGTKKMIELGADLSATFGGSTQEAVDALSAAFRGEADSAERYGLNLSMTAVNAELARKGQDKLTGSALTQAKAQAVMALATKQAGGSIGQFGREADTAAGAQQRASAQWKNAQADLGAGLLPIMQKAGQVIAVLSKWMSENTGVVKVLAAAILGAAIAVKVLNAAMNASPIARIIALVAAVAAGLVVLYQKSETFRKIVNAVWTSVRAAAVAAWGVIRGVITTAWRIISTVWNGARAFFSGLFSAIAAIARGVWAVIRGVITAVVVVVRTIWSALSGFFSGLFRGISTVARGIWSAIRAVITAVVGVVRTIWSGLSGFFSGLFSGISSVVSTIWGAISSVIGGVVGAVQTVWSGITSFFSGLWDGISATVSTIWGGIQTAIGAVVDAVKGVWSGITEFFSLLWFGISNAVGNVWDGISSVITGVVDAIKGAWDALTGFFSRLWEGIKSVIKGIWDWIMARVQDVKDAVAYLAPGGGASQLGPNSLLPAAGFTGSGAGTGAEYGPTRYTTNHVTIHVTGAGRPDEVARQIKGILTGRDRRAGGLVLG